MSALRAPLLLTALALSAACGSSSSSSSVSSPSQVRCAVEARADSTTFAPDGGAGTVRITTARECGWSARSDAAWLTLTPPVSGQGEGTVAFRVAANGDPGARTTAISVEDQRVQVAQEGRPCAFQLSSLLETVDAAGGERTVQIGASSAQCRWTAASEVPWIVIMSVREGSGNGAVTFRVEPLAGPARVGSLTIGGHVLRVEQGAGCGFTVANTTFSFSPSGGRGEVPIETSPGCAWSAQSLVPWIAIVGSGMGSGAGTVLFLVEPSETARTGTLTVAGRVVTITQAAAACTYSVDPTAYSAPAAGGSSTFSVRTGANCAWTTASEADWIATPSGQTGTGPGEVRVTVGANSGAARTGSLTIAGQRVTVTQASGCNVTVSPLSVSVGAAASSGVVRVSSGAGCPWSSTSGAGWITITDGASGSGNGEVRFSVAANIGPARDGSLSIGGRAVPISQASGCTYAISPAAQDVSGIGGSGSVTVTTAAGCPWTASSNADWIALASAAGTGPGPLAFTVAANQGPARSGTFQLAGHTFTVRQASPCTWSFSPPSHLMDANGGNGAILVLVSGPCTWTAVSNVSWITVTAGASGLGGGLVQIAVAANPGAARTGTLTIGGERYEVAQAGR